MDKTKPQTLFEKLYNATQDAVERAKMPLVEKRIKRRFQAAFDDATGQILDAEAELDDLRRKFSNFSVNGILGARLEILALRESQEIIAEEYEKLFGETLSER